MEFLRDSSVDFSPGSNMTKVAAVTINQETQQVEGWDQIWAIIDGEEKIKQDTNINKNQKLEELKQSGVTDYIQEVHTSNEAIKKGPIDIAALRAEAAAAAT